MSSLNTKLLRKIEYIDNSRILKFLRLRQYAREIIESTLELYHLSTADDTPRIAAIVGLLGVIWVVVPYDFDFVPLLGWIDDISILHLSKKFARWVSPPETVSEAEDQSSQGLTVAIDTARDSTQNWTEAAKNFARTIWHPISKLLAAIWIFLGVRWFLDESTRRGMHIYGLLSVAGLLATVGLPSIYPQHTLSLVVRPLLSTLSQVEPIWFFIGFWLLVSSAIIDIVLAELVASISVSVLLLWHFGDWIPVILTVIWILAWCLGAVWTFHGMAPEEEMSQKQF